MNEKQIAGASYILNFFQYVHQIGHYHAIYVNMLLELQHKYGDSDDFDKVMPEEEKSQLMLNMQSLRYFIMQAYTHYHTIRKKLNITEELDKNLKNAYARIMGRFMIGRDDAQELLFYFNDILVTDVIQSVLENYQDLLSSIYNTPDGEENKSPTVRD